MRGPEAPFDKRELLRQKFEGVLPLHAACLSCGEEPFCNPGPFLGLIAMADPPSHNRGPDSAFHGVAGGFDYVVIQESEQPVLAGQVSRG